MKTTLVLAFSLAAGAASAQTPAPTTAAPAPTAQVDARFASWLGCWRLEDDLAGTGARLCITPDTPGVRLQTVIATVVGSTERLQADGVKRPIVDKECTGTERAEWSADGQRLFRHTDVTCGAEPARKIASIAFLNPGPSWINVQLVEGGGDRAVRVQRYRRAINQTLADGSPVMQTVVSGNARTLTADDALWNVADVIEASGKVPAEAVQAAVAEAKGRFDLNKKSLVALADAGVSETVIDLMIGIAFPQRFVVERRGNYGSSAPVGIAMGGYYDPFMAPFLMGSAFADCYGYTGFGYRSYYSACGSMYSPYYSSLYGNYGYGNYYGNYYPGGWVSVNPEPTAGIPQVEGRVVNGRGYTQVRPRESEPPVRTGNNGNGSSAGWSGANSGGSSGVSSQGYSGGSTGSSTGSSGSSGDSGARTAVPRPPGGAF